MHDFRRRFPILPLLAAVILATSSVLRADDTGENTASAHLLEAELALHGDDYLRAVREYRKAAELSDSVEIARQATRLAFDFGFDDDAVRAASRWHELEPDSDEALVFLGQAQLRDGDIRAARRSFSVLIKRGDRPPEERIFSLLGLITEEDPERSDELMRGLAKPYEDTALANYAMAATALQAEDLEFARERAKRAIDLDPKWIKAKLLYARVMLLEGDADRAIDYTARIIGDDPDPDPDARMELALMYMTAGRDDDALSQVNQVLLERASRTDALRMMAIINFRQNNLDAAWDDFEDLLSSGDYTADALFYLARISDYRGEVDRAIRLYSQVVTGKNAITSQRRASALIAFQNDDPEAAIEALDDFADGRPRYAVDMVLAKAQLLASLGRHPEALVYYEKAVEYRPDSENVALGRAELLLRMDRLDDSIRAYRAAAKRWPESSVTLNALGYTLADRTDEYRDAEKFIRKALKYDPDSPAIIDSLGWVLHKRGKHEEALEQLERAYKAFPDHEVAAHLVEVLVVLEREDEALELLVAAELENPQSDLLSDVRERFFPEAP
ncbi:MAG: tetratricopeptide repeat protein [Gammaproteobacteria bacterium]|nr:tetratricopeptide repeat protein [Gammaproteobacteria bacterium]